MRKANISHGFKCYSERIRNPSENKNTFLRDSHYFLSLCYPVTNEQSKASSFSYEDQVN